MRTAVEEIIVEQATPYLDAYWVKMSSRQRDILVNLRAWGSAGESCKDDPDITALVRDGFCVFRPKELEYGCHLFKVYFYGKGRAEHLLGHQRPSRDAAMANAVKALENLGACVGVLSDWDDNSEKPIQEVAFFALRSQFDSVAREVQVATGPKRAYRCDIVLEDFDILVEIKRVRSSAHASTLQAEINDDLIGYRESDKKRRVIVLIWDRQRFISDRKYFAAKYEVPDGFIRVVFGP